MVAKKSESKEISIVRVQHGILTACILGTTPLILNRMSEKVMRELLMPKGKKTTADKAANLKHDPMQEFKDSPYLDSNDGPTLIQHLSSAFKRAIADAALDAPGSNKSQIGRLVWVEGERVSIYGIPKLFMSVTRSADMNKTPDIRTRSIMPEWCAEIRISFVKPILNETAVANLLAWAAMSQGVGDWRTGKGKGTYGSFSIVDKNDETFKRIIKTGARKQQEAAMKDPGFYDEDSERLYHWYEQEIVKRGQHEMLAGSTKRKVA